MLEPPTDTTRSHDMGSTLLSGKEAPDGSVEGGDRSVQLSCCHRNKEREVYGETYRDTRTVQFVMHQNEANGKNKIYDSLKQTSKVTADTPKEPKMPDPRKGDDIGKVKASVEGGKLRQLLNELHSDEDQ